VVVEPAVFRCSLRNGRVALMASVTGLLAAGWLAVGLFAGIPGGQVLPWLGVGFLIVGSTGAYLSRTKIVIDAEQVRVHSLIGSASARRTAVTRISSPRSGLGFFTDADGKVLASFQDAYTPAQLSKIAGLLGVARD
jgi:hypothetical protein